MIRSLRETAHLFSTDVVLVVDHDDPCLHEYLALPRQFTEASGGFPLRPPDRPLVMVLGPDETGDLTRATNSAARRVWDDDVIIGHVGDDHRFRTPGWDKAITAALAQPGFAYGNDLHQGPSLPTAVFVSAVIPRTLGWFALPVCAHMRIDRAWKRMGEELGRITYLPDVVIEHLHPDAGKAPDDPGYERARAGWRADKRAYRAWIEDGFASDVSRVREAIWTS